MLDVRSDERCTEHYMAPGVTIHIALEAWAIAKEPMPHHPDCSGSLPKCDENRPVSGPSSTLVPDE